MRGVELVDVDIYGEIENVTINGVAIGPLINAELDKRYPDRAKMRPRDPAGFREAWDVIERLWHGTVDRARRLPPELLHESVNGEWSFTETLRHLVFATDSWIRRAILGDPSPWHPLDLPWDEMPDIPGVPRDRKARPSLGEVLELRRDRMSTVRQVIDGLTDESLDGHTEAVEIAYDPRKVTYAQLLEVFWRNIDPLTADRQFCDVGSQYRTGIYVHDETQRRLAEESKRAVAQRLQKPVVTEIAAASRNSR